MRNDLGETIWLCGSISVNQRGTPMGSGKTATVFGASGFIGRHVVKRLADRGYIIRAAVRDTERATSLRPLGGVGQIVPLYAPVTSTAAVRRAVANADCVINLVGILSERRAGDFERVHYQGAALIAAESAAAGVAHLVHISAIGADPESPSLYAASKGRAEAAIRAAYPAAVILRPSIVFGPEDHFFNRFGAMAMRAPIMPVIAGAIRFQPVYVEDVADAVMAAIDRPEAAGHLYELGGPAVRSFRALLEYTLAETRRHRRLLDIPPWLANLQACVLERLPGKLLTRDQLLLLRNDNVANPDLPGLRDLGITPTPIDLVVPTFLARYRPTGNKD